MDLQTANLSLPATEISAEDAFEIVDFKAEAAPNIDGMNDKGHPDDWGRFDASEQPNWIKSWKTRVHEMKDGKVFWYKFSIFIPNSVGSDHHTISPFDLKDRKKAGKETQPWPSQ